jgi:hypothetical protein
MIRYEEKKSIIKKKSSFHMKSGYTIQLTPSNSLKEGTAHPASIMSVTKPHICANKRRSKELSNKD